MQLFQINQSEDSSKITIKFNNTCDQLHQRSVTSAINYNRTYSKTCHLDHDIEGERWIEMIRGWHHPPTLPIGGAWVRRAQRPAGAGTRVARGKTTPWTCNTRDTFSAWRDLQLHQVKHHLCTKGIKYFESIRTSVQKAVSDHAEAVVR